MKYSIVLNAVVDEKNIFNAVAELMMLARELAQDVPKDVTSNWSFSKENVSIQVEQVSGVANGASSTL